MYMKAKLIYLNIIWRILGQICKILPIGLVTVSNLKDVIIDR